MPCCCGQPERASGVARHAVGLDERDAPALLLVDLGDGASARCPTVSPAGCEVVTWRTTVLVSPVSITSGGDQDRAEHEHDQSADDSGEDV